MGIEDAFRRLREAWFMSHVYQHAHERQWEEIEDEQWRERCNLKAKEQFDLQTEEIIAGKEHNLTPRCLADLK